MTASHGSKASFQIGSSALPTTLQDISIYANALGLPFKRDAAETTTMTRLSKTYIPGLKDATLPFSGPWDTVADPIIWDLYNTAAIVNFKYCPAGVGVTGTPAYTGNCFCTSAEIASDVGDADQFTGEFQVTGDVTRTTQ